VHTNIGKIHFGIALSDIPRAWNLLANLFIEKDCKFGIKSCFQAGWPDEQRGREITFYIYRYYDPNTVKYIPVYLKNHNYQKIQKVPRKKARSYCHEFKKNASNPFDIYQLTQQEEESIEKIKDFLVTAERLLFGNKITPSGCAIGDKPLGMYASLRNEAFIYDEQGKNFIYPPNAAGYNGALQKDKFYKHLKVLSKGSAASCYCVNTKLLA